MIESNTVTSAYIHIPFCKTKCNYCSFISDVNFDKKERYISSLFKEINYYYNGESLKTLYIGGGTPSILNLEEVESILKKFNYTDTTEITIELNPNDISKEYMRGLKSMGVNRVSIGAQTFNENILKIIGRRHSAKEIHTAVELTKEAGFDNINLDLIYGLPTQTLSGFEDDLIKITDLDIPHLSLYGLKIEKDCFFYNNMPDNIPDDDTQADMYLLAKEITEEKGYNHYEISNYSKQNYKSKHNTNYWNCGEYYGFGLSSHGYTNGLRYNNTSDMNEYIISPTIHKNSKKLTKKEMLEERIFLGFRLSEGIDKNKINNDFNINFDEKYSKTLEKFLNTQYIEKTNNGYKFCDNKKTNGFLLSNIILSEFI